MAKEPDERPASCGAARRRGARRRSASRRHDRHPAAHGGRRPRWRRGLAAAASRRPWSSRPEATAPRPRRQGGSLVRDRPGHRSRHRVATAVSAIRRSVTAARNRVWVGDFRDGSLWRLDPARGDLQRFTTTGEPRDLDAPRRRPSTSQATARRIFDGAVTRYDAVTGAREAGVDLLACSVAAGRRRRLGRGLPVRRAPVDGAGRASHAGDGARAVSSGPHRPRRSAFAMRDMAVGEGCALGHRRRRRPPRLARRSADAARSAATTRLPFAPRSIAAGAGGVWVTGPMRRRRRPARRADGPRAADDPCRPRRRAASPSARERSGWRARSTATVSRIDPSTGQVVATDPGRRLAARDRRRRRRRLGDGRCRLGARSSSPHARGSPWPSRRLRLRRAGRPDRRARPTARARSRGFGDGELAGAELPFLARGARLLGTGPSDGVSADRGRRPARRARAAAARRRASTRVYIEEARRLVEDEHVDAVVSAARRVVTRELARRVSAARSSSARSGTSRR